jgi:hypothetical protein
MNGGQPFSGTHSDGDILLVSDFTAGGSTSSLQVFRWTGTDSTGSLVALNSGSGDTFAIVNAAPISVPWSFTNKNGATQPDAGEFLEEGVDLTALNLQGGFASFLAKLGPAQGSANHTDFVIGGFSLMAAMPTASAGVFAAGSSFASTDVPSTQMLTYNLSGGPGSLSNGIATQSGDTSVFDNNHSSHTVHFAYSESFTDTYWGQLAISGEVCSDGIP